jgi:hypothetical protein
MTMLYKLLILLISLQLVESFRHKIQFRLKNKNRHRLRQTDKDSAKADPATKGDAADAPADGQKKKDCKPAKEEEEEEGLAKFNTLS